MFQTNGLWQRLFTQESIYKVSKNSSLESLQISDYLAKSASVKIDVNKFFKKTSIRLCILKNVVQLAVVGVYLVKISMLVAFFAIFCKIESA